MPSKIAHTRQSVLRLDDSAFVAGFFKALRHPLELFLDYDGTLVPLAATPSQALLPPATRDLLVVLLQKPSLELVVISGREAGFLSAQFRDLPLTLVCEHGARLYQPQQGWRNLVPAAGPWYACAEALMQTYCAKVPQSLIEHKNFSVAWHYRLAPESLHALASELRQELETGLAHMPVSILAGDKVLEVRGSGAGKGDFIRRYLAGRPHGQTTWMAIGDDVTDEEMMQALPDDALTIKVGPAPSLARYRLANPNQVLQLLHLLAQWL